MFSYLLVVKKKNVKKCNSLTKWKQGLDLEDKAWCSYFLISYQSTVDINMKWFQQNNENERFIAEIQNSCW